MKADRHPAIRDEDSSHRKTARWLIPTLGLAGVLCATLIAKAQTITYGYDSNGRLVCVTNASGTTAVYAYDTGGNLTSITNTACPVTQPTPGPSMTPPTPAATPTP